MVDSFTDRFANYINTMQKGNIYIGCEFGTYKTDNALLLNYLFNPKTTQSRPYVKQLNEIYLDRMVNLYNNLTSKQKELMGWTKEFDLSFISKLKTLMAEYDIPFKI